MTERYSSDNNSGSKLPAIVKNNGSVEFIAKTHEFNAEKFRLEYDRVYSKIVKRGTFVEINKFVKTLLNKSKVGVVWNGRE